MRSCRNEKRSCRNEDARATGWVGVAVASLFLALAATGCSIAGRGTLSAPRQSTGAARGVSASLANVSLSFIENQGQLDPSVGYFLQGRDTSVRFRPGGVTFASAGIAGAQRDGTSAPSSDRSVLNVDFAGAGTVSPLGEDRAPGVVSYFSGPPERWKTGVPTFNRVVYRDLWPGIDAIYGGKEGHLKYSFVVRPGADPAQIRLVFRGASTARVSSSGELEVATPAGTHTEAAPVTYQDANGKRVEIPSAYVVETGSEAGTWSVGLPVGDYDHTETLVIDPAIAYAGYLGGGSQDQANDIAVDATGAAYVGGTTGLEGFPVTVGFNQTPSSGGGGFLAKVHPSGTHLEYSAFFEGVGIKGVAVDTGGIAYVAGGQGYPGAVPLAVGPDLTDNGGGDAFVARINSAGTSLDYAGFIGGTSEESAIDVAVDAVGAAYVTGYTYSAESSFPVAVGPDVTFGGGGHDVFVAKVRTDGAGLDYAGYIGGAGADGSADTGGFHPGPHIAVDAIGAAYVSSGTSSTQASFPVTVGPDLTFNSATRSSVKPDAFVAKVRPDGTGFAYAGFIGGKGEDWAAGIAVDSAGNAYVGGTTGSGSASFPTIVGPALTSKGNGEDAFVVKVRADGTGFVYGGFVGSGGRDVGQDVAVDSAGAAYVVGYTSSQRVFPGLSSGFDATYGGGPFDSFLVKVNPDGKGFQHGSFIGGAGQDDPRAMALDPFGAVYIAGVTNSDETSFPVAVGPDLTFNTSSSCTIFGGGRCFDAFVVKVNP